MAPTISFAPLAERLEAQALKIRSDLAGRTLVEQFYGVMVCILLYAWCRICHQLDARADDQGRMPLAADAGSHQGRARDGAAGETAPAGAGRAASRPLLRLVA